MVYNSYIDALAYSASETHGQKDSRARPGSQKEPSVVGLVAFGEVVVQREGDREASGDLDLSAEVLDVVHVKKNSS